MNRNERGLADANARVEGWASLSADERAALLAERPTHIADLRSGGAMLSVNGVDRWCASWRHAEAEREALTKS